MQRGLSSIFHNVLVDNLWISCKTNPNFTPGADNGHKIKVAGLLRQRFIEKIQNSERRFTLDWLECPGWRRSSNNFIGSVITFLGFTWRRYLATLVTRQNCTKNAVQFAYFIIRRKKSFCFFEQLLSNFPYKKQRLWLLSEHLWSNRLRSYGKLFGKSRTTCGKPLVSAQRSTRQSAKHLQIESVFQFFDPWKYYFWNLHKICFLMVVCCRSAKHFFT